jgi:hypothetical protein
MPTSELDAQTLVAEMRKLRDDVARVAEDLHETIRHLGGDAFAKAHDSAERVWDEAKHRTDDLAREIEKRPLTAALGAFGLGMLVGLIFSGRRA